MMRALMLLATCLCMLHGAALPPGARTLGVGLITRHGDRDVLRKTGNGFMETTPGTLTRAGYARMETLGKFLKDKVAPKVLLDVDEKDYRVLHSRVMARSSGFDRTIASGDAVLEGLLGHIPRRPVVYSTPDEFDLTLRAYKKCSTFQAAVEARRQEPDYLALGQSTLALRQAAADYIGYPLQDELHDVWNLYEDLRIALLDDPHNATLATHLAGVKGVRDQASDYEYAAAKGHVVAGLFLSEINTHIESLMNLADAAVPKYRHWFAHYPTLVTLSTLLDLNLTGVPDFGATLYYELARDDTTGDAYVVWRMLNPEDVSDTNGVTGFDKDLLVQKAVDYLDATQPRLASKEAWCKGCVGPNTFLDVCQKYVAVSATPAPPSCPVCSTEDSCSKNLVAWQIFLGAILGILLGCVATVVALRMLSGRSGGKYRASNLDQNAGTPQNNEADTQEMDGPIEMQDAA